MDHIKPIERPLSVIFLNKRSLKTNWSTKMNTHRKKRLSFDTRRDGDMFATPERRLTTTNGQLTDRISSRDVRTTTSL